MKYRILKMLLGVPIRIIELCSRYWIKCNVHSTSVVLGFTAIDDLTLVGKYTYINRFCEIARSSIGNYCSIGSGVRIGSGEHDIKLISTSSFITGHTENDLTKTPCIIENDVWIGTHAFVKGGVKNGNGIVIGANAVVTKDVTDFAIVVGNPARIIKYRFSEIRMDEITKSKHWDLELPEAVQVSKCATPNE